MAKVDAMSLMAASAKDVTATAKNQSIRKVEGNTDSFGQYMAKRNDTSEEQTFVKAKESFKGNEFSNDAKPNYVKKKEYVSELGNGNEAAVAGSVSIEQASRIVSEIRQIVKSELSTDDAAIDQTLGSMGITALDLLNPDVLKDFLLQLNNADSTELLTNELLLNSLQSVTELLSDFAEENQAPVFALMELLDTQMSLDEVVEPEVFESFMQQLTGDSGGTYIAPDRQDGLAENATVANQTTGTVPENATESAKAEGETPDSFLDRISVISVEHSEESEGQTQDSGMNFAQNGNSQGEPSVMKGSVSLAEAKGVEEESATVADELSNESNEAVDVKELRSADEDRMPLFTLNSEEHVVQGNVNDIAEANFQSAGRMLQAIDITRQISEQMRTTLTEGTTRLEMQLNPESLGKVLLTISAKEGMMTATFRVQTEEARQALESQMFTLKENLEAKNIKVEAVDVQISNFNFSENRETDHQLKEEMAKRAKRKFDFSVAEEEEETESSAEQVRRSVMRDQGRSIDFTA